MCIFFMYIFMCVCTCACACACACAYACVFACACACVCARAHVRVLVFVCVMHACVCVCKYVYTYIGSSDFVWIFFSFQQLLNGRGWSWLEHIWQQYECDLSAISLEIWQRLQDADRHSNTLQHTATHCNTLQHTAIHCNTLQQCVLSSISLATDQDHNFYESSLLYIGITTFRKKCRVHNLEKSSLPQAYGLAMMSMLSKLICLFRKRALCLQGSFRPHYTCHHQRMREELQIKKRNQQTRYFLLYIG